MKILVPVKRVIDANVPVRVKRDRTGVETGNVRMSINPFCEIALEEAVRLREAGQADEVIVVTIGDSRCIEVLRTGLAMGADRALHIRSDDRLYPLAVAGILGEIVRREEPRLVMLGKLAIDDENNQTGQMLAGLLNWGQGTFASKTEIAGDRVEVTREVDAGLEIISLALPAVITADLRLNEPRYIKLPELVKAKKKPVEEIPLPELDVNTGSAIRLLEMTEPPQRPSGVRVHSVRELVEKLRNEAKVI